MNHIAWQVIHGFIDTVGVMAVLSCFFGSWTWKSISVFAVIVFILIFGALLIGKFFFPY